MTRKKQYLDDHVPVPHLNNYFAPSFHFEQKKTYVFCNHMISQTICCGKQSILGNICFKLIMKQMEF